MHAAPSGFLSGKENEVFGAGVGHFPPCPGAKNKSDKGGSKKALHSTISKAPPGIAEGRLRCFTIGSGLR